MKSLSSKTLFAAAVALAGVLMMPASNALAESAPADGLAPVKVKRLDEVRAKPGVAWGEYTHVQLLALDVSDVAIKAPAQTHKRDIKPLTDKQKAALSESYARAFTRELIEDGIFKTAEQGAANTLVIRAKLVEIAPNYIPSSGFAMSGRHRVYAENAGKMTMTFELLDGASGELLAQITDEREGTRMWREINPVEVRSQTNQIMSSWARIFRNHLDDLGRH
ncbi:DUF3313 domain-containing protein [Simiduia sp. 21SJ11W-1]|uniref:DUF3313 family protein n=1 Tax=Simiduia sp. 21SJ11W-1 TaxID=2909669 RepID=UPI0020A05222|nr:DUF3313 family protein [Simiduia sp. 21SJ11W-1]UTA48181.1 DUF3313 domain-containing protein [Simiduia sp. 21SJ11W-1]